MKQELKTPTPVIELSTLSVRNQLVKQVPEILQLHIHMFIEKDDYIKVIFNSKNLNSSLFLIA